MTRMLVGTIAIALWTAPAVGQAGRLPSITLPPPLDRVLRDYERAWAAGDPEGLVGLFTDDGFVPTSQGWRRGSAAIREEYARAGGELRLRALAFAVQDTVGYIVGAYGYGSDAAETDRGKFLLAVRRESGGPWRIAADLDSANRE